MPDEPSLTAASVLVHAGRPPRTPGAPLSVPIELTSTYAADGAISYGRSGNRTWEAFEEVLGRLEGGRATAFASGMAAIAAAAGLAAPGRRVVLPASAYNVTGLLFDEMAAQRGIPAVRVDLTDTEAVIAELDGAGLLWLESPSNPLLDVADLPELIAAAASRDVVVVCDNTFATPLVQRPLELGADVVVHSATKYLAGHSDVLLGAAVTARTERGEDAHERLLRHRLVHGAVPGPVEAWLALRGMRTLHLRVERATATAAELARRLDGHPAVSRVRYPGWGAVVSVEVIGGAGAAEAVAGRVQLWTHATSLGGVESLLERRRRWPAEPETVPEELLRLSVGIEDVDDLWRDLDRALAGAGREVPTGH